MALQSPSHPMFAQVPDEFFSPFPSNDSLLSGKYQALTRGKAKLSEEYATMQQAKAFQHHAGDPAENARNQGR